MSIKSDRWIREMCRKHGMIDPFEEKQVRRGVISYGVSSYGYDIRIADEFKIFTNVNSTIVDPKHMDPGSMVDFKGPVAIVPPNSFALGRTVEYFRIPRNVLTITVGKSTYARCFRADTRVALVDGTEVSLEDMAHRAASGERFWGYSLGPSGRIIMTLLEAPRYVGRDSLIELELDNGESIHCTPDHVFVLRGGKRAEAHELSPGASLMPLDRQQVRGHESVYQPLSGHLEPTHRMADEWNLRNRIYSEGGGTHRHHRDGDRRNNRPWNIERMPARDHIRLHDRKNDGADFDPEEHGRAIRAAERHEKKSEPTRRHFSDAKQCARHAESSRAAWARDAGERRDRQQEMARRIRIREEITAEAVAAALNEAGSIRDAARLPGRDRTGFRRFAERVAAVRGNPRLAASRHHQLVRARELPGDHDVYCLTVPEAGNFALAAGVFALNCGIITNVTPFEPEWEGHVTLEISNTTPLPAKIYSNEGIAQVLFFEGDEACEVSYKDKAGKYQAQRGITLSRL